MTDLKLNRLAAGVLTGALFLAVACSPREDASGSPAAAQGPELAIPRAEAAGTPPAADSSPGAAAGSDEPGGRWIPLPDRLRSELEDGRIPEEQFQEWLRTRAEQDNPGDEPVAVVRADLDGDGFEREWAAVVYESRLEASGEYRYAYGIVAAYRDGKYEWQSFVFPEEDYGRASIEAIGDLDGDGKPEIVWASLGIGAHTSTFTYTASGWDNGKLRPVQGAAIVPSATGAAIRDGKLTVTGGMIHSVGAGPWQREYTDIYTAADGALKRVSRAFADAPTPYHRLLDGLWAEADGNAEQALRHYEAAAAMKAESYRDYAFVFDGEWAEGGTLEDEERKFEEIVHRFARFRRELLELRSQGADEERACAAARKKSGYASSWLAYLNAPAGYANPAWSDEAVCAPIDELVDR
ncbi:hypothetical protein [Cohnella hongkongensis]|uniref:FG-GAP repeat protein n=1 Tax=Cohnella hongkongensis TaxID=178337 RepID=A0ABV9FFN7_9BACL